MKCLLITDSRVNTLYGEALMEEMRQDGAAISSFVIPEGERYKTRKTKEEIEDAMLAHNMGQDSLIIALGGGVILDLAGFVAATYCRGIPYLSIPTTLLGMIDAGIGGKTGVNLCDSKNHIGAFHTPISTFLYPPFLRTLPEREWRNGYAEMIKYGIIASERLFEKLESGTFSEDMIYESIQIKQDVVDKDPYDRGVRRILNFGHTIGHALETFSAYRLGHGEAVAIGMAVESYISMKRAGLPYCHFERIISLLSTYGFALSPIPPFEELLPLLSHDKKCLNAEPRFVMVRSIGLIDNCGGAFCDKVPLSLIQEAYEATYCSK